MTIKHRESHASLLGFGNISIALLLATSFSVGTAKAEIAFEDVTEASGLQRAGASFGASWGSFNGDDYPDLWISNHWYENRLYVNNGDGTLRMKRAHFPLRVVEIRMVLSGVTSTTMETRIFFRSPARITAPEVIATAST